MEENSQSSASLFHSSIGAISLAIAAAVALFVDIKSAVRVQPIPRWTLRDR
jgi:hypothetical protein